MVCQILGEPFCCDCIVLCQSRDNSLCDTLGLKSLPCRTTSDLRTLSPKNTHLELDPELLIGLKCIPYPLSLREGVRHFSTTDFDRSNFFRTLWNFFIQIDITDYMLISIYS